MSLYKQKGSEIWWTLVYHNGRVRRSTGTTDRAEAQRFENKLKVELDQSNPKIKGKTWGDAVGLWLDAEPRSRSELLSLAKFGRLYGDRALHTVTRESIHDVLDAFCETVGTYTRYRTMIAAILNRAKAEGWINEVPKLTVKKDKKRKAREWLTREQWEKLYVELPVHMRPMAEFAIETGLRQANVLQLRWKTVSIERALVWVEAEDTKADEAIAVPLSSRALEILKALQGQNEVFVFTYRGKPVTEVKTAFLAACVRAGLGTMTRWTDKAGKKHQVYAGFTWHGFRHTWATWHVQKGTPLDVLQKLGAWSDPRMVLTYAHHSAGYLASFANNHRINNVDTNQ